MQSIPARKLPPLSSALVLLLCAGIASAAPVTFIAEAGGELRRAQVDTIYIRDVPYVRLDTLCEAFGGAVRMLRDRVQIDLHGHSAMGDVNGRTVNSSRKRFELSEPLIRHTRGPMIALRDVNRFFDAGFNVAVQRAAEGEPAPVEEGEADPPGLRALPDPLQGPAVQAPAREPARWRQEERPFDTVIIDPGHGGTDSGVVGQSGLAEKAVSLAVANALRRVLKESTNLNSHMTREEDAELGLRERANAANGNQGDLLVSIHAAASFAPQAHGVQVFYAGSDRTAGQQGAAREPAGQALSQRIAEAVAKQIADKTGAESQAVHEIPLRMFRYAAMPGILVEVGFLSTPAEEALLKTDRYQSRIAEAIAAGIVETMPKREAGP